MLRLMFKHKASSKQTQQGIIKDIKVNGIVGLLTQFRDKHTYSGGYLMSKTTSVRFYQSSKKRVSFQQGVVQFD